MFVWKFSRFVGCPASPRQPRHHSHEASGHTNKIFNLPRPSRRRALRHKNILLFYLIELPTCNLASGIENTRNILAAGIRNSPFSYPALNFLKRARVRARRGATGRGRTGEALVPLSSTNKPSPSGQTDGAASDRQ